MHTLDHGHRYSLHVLDQKPGITEECILTFVKREDTPGTPVAKQRYPGNVGRYPGTILQECWRAEIARLKYLDQQIWHQANTWCIANLRQCIYYLEIRAAQRHGTDFVLQSLEGIEDLLPCRVCGHIFNHIHPAEGQGVLNTFPPEQPYNYMQDDRHKTHQSPG